MYFPFLRGKQFELIALREIAQTISKSNNINPIIEPVKKKTSTYTKTIGILQNHNINFTIIINPIVGDLKNNMEYVCQNLMPSLYYDNFQLGIIIDSNTNLNKISNNLNDFGLSKQPIVLILEVVNDSSLDGLIEFIKNYNIKYIIIGKQIRSRRTILRTIKKENKNLITLSDPYIKQVRNKDYASEVDEFFSEEHLYFEDEGYIGYSNYLTIGHEYSDKGFSPYAVAIHLTYKKSHDIFRIHHFVSDSNDDFSDVAGKFEEALTKLIPFINDKNIQTLASHQFRLLHKEERYPGLGTVKKLSILHHLELVNDYFS